MSEIRLNIKGSASNTNQLIVFKESKESISLMEFLRSKSVSVASSCYGEGVCQKCTLLIDGSKELSCQVPMTFFEEDKTYNIAIDYL